MKFFDRVKAVFGGAKTRHPAAVPGNVPRPAKPHGDKKAAANPRFEEGPRRANTAETEVWRAGSRKKRDKVSAPPNPRKAGRAAAAGPDTPWDRREYQVAPAEDQTRFLDVDLPDVLLHALADLNFRYGVRGARFECIATAINHERIVNNFSIG